jgi:hypothetical protein
MRYIFKLLLLIVPCSIQVFIRPARRWLRDNLKALGAHLVTCTVFVGEQITLADVTITVQVQQATMVKWALLCMHRGQPATDAPQPYDTSSKCLTFEGWKRTYSKLHIGRRCYMSYNKLALSYIIHITVTFNSTRLMGKGLHVVVDHMLCISDLDDR